MTIKSPTRRRAGRARGRGVEGDSDFLDFLDAGDVAAAFEGGGEPGADDGEGLFDGDGALAEGEDVGVVVGAVPDGHLLVPAEAAAHAFDFIGDDGFAVAGAAEDDAVLELAAGDRFGGGANPVGIVAGGVGVGAEVLHGVAVGKEHGFDGFLVFEAGVVGADGDGVFGSGHEERGEGSEELGELSGEREKS